MQNVWCNNWRKPYRHIFNHEFHNSPTHAYPSFRNSYMFYEKASTAFVANYLFKDIYIAKSLQDRDGGSWQDRAGLFPDQDNEANFLLWDKDWVELWKTPYEFKYPKPGILHLWYKPTSWVLPMWACLGIMPMDLGWQMARELTRLWRSCCLLYHEKSSPFPLTEEYPVFCQDYKTTIG